MKAFTGLHLLLDMKGDFERIYFQKICRVVKK